MHKDKLSLLLENLKVICYPLVTFCLLLVAPAMAAAQSSETKVLSVDEMRSDLELLHKILTEAHPNLYRGITKNDAEKNWRRTAAKITAPLSATQFQNLLNPLVNGYADGHTYLALPLESAEYRAYVKNGDLFFPFQIWESDDRIFVTESLGELRLPRGTEIVGIGGERAKSVVRALKNSVPGDTAASRAATAARLFAFLLWQLRDRSNEFRLKIRRPNAATMEFVAARGITDETLRKNIFADKVINFYEFTAQIAVLEINSMPANDDVKKQIADAFAQIKAKNYQSLVIDIRRNGGGNSVVADWVFEHLTDEPLRHSDIKEVRLSPYLIEKNKFFRDWTNRLKESHPPEGDRIFLRNIDDVAASRKAAWLYGGRVFLLTAPRTYSSAFMMAETFKCYGLGVIVGETPGSYRNLTGELMNFRLPNSKIVGYVSTSQYFPPCYQKSKTDFLKPDVKIDTSLADVIAGRDAALEYVKKTTAN